MIYLSQLMGNPVLDSEGEKIGSVSDLGIATGEVFPRITSLAFMGPGRTPMMISWRKYVDTYDEDVIRLKVPSTEIRFSYLQPNEVLLARDILNKQIVDTRGIRVVRVNDLKLSDTSSTQLRLLGAEVGARGLLRSLSPQLEHLVTRIARAMGHPMQERIIAWSYMDLVERDLSNVKLSVSHKTLDELHPADVADIIERLDSRLRSQVFAQLDDEQRAGAMAEFNDDAMAVELIGGLNEKEASRILSEMDPDDAAELVSELSYDRAEKLLRLMGVKEQRAIRQLLGYREYTAGRIMTSEALSVPEAQTVAYAFDRLRNLDEDFETVRYLYLTDEDGRLSGIVTLNRLIVSEPETRLEEIANKNLVTASPEDDQEDVARNIAKYNLLAMPVVSDDNRLLGIVTVDDALDVLEEEHAEDLQIVGGGRGDSDSGDRGRNIIWFLHRNLWLLFWVASVVGAAFVVTAATSDPTMGIFAALCTITMPISLNLSENTVNYVTNFFLTDDPGSEKSPSI
ncbi:MAG: CBS domain-containing protein, partial [Atopobium sp.]|nr:CBS domain-containing protein [Atopobium sp.]